MLPSGLLYTHGLLYTYVTAILGGMLKAVGPSLLQAEMVYRIPNLLISVAAMSALFFSARQWFGRRAALIALTLMVVYPHGIVWGARVRMYTLIFLFVPLVAYTFYRAALCPENRRWCVLALGLFSIGVMAHNWMMLLVPPLIVGAGISAWGSGSLKRWRRLLPALFIIGLVSFISIRLASLWLATPEDASQDMGWQGLLLATLGRLNLSESLANSETFLTEFVWQNPFNLPVIALTMLGLPALWWLRPARGQTKKQKQIFRAMVYLYVLFLGVAAEFIFIVKPDLKQPRYAAPVILLAFIIWGGWFELGLSALNRYRFRRQTAVAYAAIPILLAGFGWLSAMQMPKIFYEGLPPVAYEKAFQFVRQNFSADDALLSPLPAAANLYFDDPGYFIGQRATHTFVHRNPQGILGDRWRGAPWLKETESFKDILRNAPRTWLVIDTFTFNSQFDSDWKQMMRRNTPKVWEEDGVMVFRGEGLVFDLPAAPDIPLDANFANLVTLTGYNRAFTGSSLQLVLFWAVQSRIPADYTTFIHIRDEAGNTVAQADVQPLSGEYPTSRWQTGETVVDDMTVALPQDLPAGTYHLLVGLYRWDTLERLPLLNDVTGENAAVLESMELK